MTSDQDRWELLLKDGQGFAADIAEEHAKYQQTDDDDYDGTCERGDIEYELQQRPLSVEVRSCWRSMNQPWEADEYRILLCTGGPAMQVTGKLDMHGQPADAVVQVQDWFKPWTEITTTTPDQDAALLWFASLFYYGAEE